MSDSLHIPAVFVPTESDDISTRAVADWRENLEDRPVVPFSDGVGHQVCQARL